MAPAPKKDSGVAEITLNWHCGKPASLRGSPRRPLVQSLFISYWDALPSIPANASAVMSSQEAEEPEATETASLPSWSNPASPAPAPAPSLPGQFVPVPLDPVPRWDLVPLPAAIPLAACARHSSREGLGSCPMTPCPISSFGQDMAL